MDIKAELQKWYDLAIQAKPSVSDGYRYIACTTEMLDLLDHAHEIPHNDAKHWKPISSDRAACQIETALTKPPRMAQKVALERIETAWKDPNWTPDVAMKSFFDLDLVYFGGYLRDKCRLQWCKGIKEEHYGWAESHVSGDVPTVKIVLNAEILLKNAKSLGKARRGTLGTLLHEMIHAYNQVRCLWHPRFDDQFDHGPSFQKVVTALHSRTIEDLGLGVSVMGNRRPKHVLRQSREGRKGDDISNPIELD